MEQLSFEVDRVEVARPVERTTAAAVAVGGRRWSRAQHAGSRVGACLLCCVPEGAKGWENVEDGS